ncbi:hypothetical protein FC694_09250 [Bacillus wiedmannii]|uniref:Fido domain-containing protein n=1 Tax=Bacillus wiedmannii TaxID=1890302 RepID=A0A4U2N094_9BACI|nr:Fic family protein [Bacillus wiedmannii]TKH17349.1 hypothetical protein FC694_09250 [Bacillus wiedmannii]
MTRFFTTNFTNMSLNLKQVNMITKINEQKGKIAIYYKLYPHIFEKLKQATRVQYIKKNINKNISAKRLQQLVLQESFPQTMLEDEICCYNDVFNLIHNNYTDIKLCKDFISEINFQLFKYQSSDSGQWRKQDLIIPDIPILKFFLNYYQLSSYTDIDASLYTLCDEYNKLKEENSLEAICLICNFILTIASINPFDAGNMKVVRMLLHFLLLKEGHIFVKYICLDTFIQNNEMTYFNSAYKSIANLCDGHNDITFCLEILLKVISEAYHELLNFIELSTLKINKVERIINSIECKKGMFTKAEIRKEHPDVGEYTIQRAFHLLQDKKQIKLICNGRNAIWQNSLHN